MTPLIPQEKESEFQKVKRIMETPFPIDFDPGLLAPWGEDEFAAFAVKEAQELPPAPDRTSLPENPPTG